MLTRILRDTCSQNRLSNNTSYPIATDDEIHSLNCDLPLHLRPFRMDLTLLPHSITSGGISRSNDSRTTALIGIMSMSKLYHSLCPQKSLPSVRPLKFLNVMTVPGKPCSWTYSTAPGDTADTYGSLTICSQSQAAADVRCRRRWRTMGLVDLDGDLSAMSRTR